ncbi:hypothetical protein SEA_BARTHOLOMEWSD_67 [Streptomyces phage BartholomewSD]|uniref:Uncharacterized protein n=1 Tax=Streptomyces phage Alvy TaxID=2599888 RepID=A0A5J6TP33_9CAUD|nr:hypothetical protein KGG89_gp27 [Streptomyces phage Alvy]QAX95516.1 hypothetical protein SEA_BARTHOLOMEWSD_67 [Streptomyces phage BartholomewSD]QFG12476.1 hypothetical protein SEA_ALVY_67 [Streptomyces phage Alvy]
MARDRDGWEYVDGAPRWAPTVEVQLANILGGIYGDEYDERKRELDDLVRAAQRDAAEKIRAHEWLECCGAGCSDLPDDAADLIFPEYPKESDSE